MSKSEEVIERTGEYSESGLDQIVGAVIAVVFFAVINGVFNILGF